MSERRPATTIGELDIHLGNAMSEISKVGDKLATIEVLLAKLATRDYVDEQVRLVHQKIQEGKPSAQLLNLSKIVAAILVLITFGGVMLEFSSTLQHLRQAMPVVTTAKP